MRELIFLRCYQMGIERQRGGPGLIGPNLCFSNIFFLLLFHVPPSPTSPFLRFLLLTSVFMGVTFYSPIVTSDLVNSESKQLCVCMAVVHVPPRAALGDSLSVVLFPILAA